MDEKRQQEILERIRRGAATEAERGELVRFYGGSENIAKAQQAYINYLMKKDSLTTPQQKADAAEMERDFKPLLESGLIKVPAPGMSLTPQMMVEAARSQAYGFEQAIGSYDDDIAKLEQFQSYGTFRGSPDSIDVDMRNLGRETNTQYLKPRGNFVLDTGKNVAPVTGLPMGMVRFIEGLPPAVGQGPRRGIPVAEGAIRRAMPNEEQAYGPAFQAAQRGKIDDAAMLFQESLPNQLGGGVGAALGTIGATALGASPVGVGALALGTGLGGSVLADIIRRNTIDPNILPDIDYLQQEARQNLGPIPAALSENIISMVPGGGLAKGAKAIATEALGGAALNTGIGWAQREMGGEINDLATPDTQQRMIADAATGLAPWRSAPEGLMHGTVGNLTNRVAQGVRTRAADAAMNNLAPTPGLPVAPGPVAPVVPVAPTPPVAAPVPAAPAPVPTTAKVKAGTPQPAVPAPTPVTPTPAPTPVAPTPAPAPAAPAQGTLTRDIVDSVYNSLGDKGVTPSAIATAANITPQEVKEALQTLIGEGKVTKTVNGRWARTATTAPPAATPAAPVQVAPTPAATPDPVTGEATPTPEPPKVNPPFVGATGIAPDPAAPHIADGLTGNASVGKVSAVLRGQRDGNLYAALYDAQNRLVGSADLGDGRQGFHNLSPALSGNSRFMNAAMEAVNDLRRKAFSPGEPAPAPTPARTASGEATTSSIEGIDYPTQNSFLTLYRANSKASDKDMMLEDFNATINRIADAGGKATPELAEDYLRLADLFDDMQNDIPAGALGANINATIQTTLEDLRGIAGRLIGDEPVPAREVPVEEPVQVAPPTTPPVETPAPAASATPEVVAKPVRIKRGRVAAGTPVETAPTPAAEPDLLETFGIKQAVVDAVAAGKDARTIANELTPSGAPKGTLGAIRTAVEGYQASLPKPPEKPKRAPRGSKKAGTPAEAPAEPVQVAPPAETPAPAPAAEPVAPVQGAGALQNKKTAMDVATRLGLASTIDALENLTSAQVWKVIKKTKPDEARFLDDTAGVDMVGFYRLARDEAKAGNAPAIESDATRAAAATDVTPPVEQVAPTVTSTTTPKRGRAAAGKPVGPTPVPADSITTIQQAGALMQKAIDERDDWFYGSSPDAQAFSKDLSEFKRHREAGNVEEAVEIGKRWANRLSSMDTAMAQIESANKKAGKSGTSTTGGAAKAGATFPEGGSTSTRKRGGKAK